MGHVCTSPREPPAEALYSVTTRRPCSRSAAAPTPGSSRTGTCRPRPSGPRPWPCRADALLDPPGVEREAVLAVGRAELQADGRRPCGRSGPRTEAFATTPPAAIVSVQAVTAAPRARPRRAAVSRPTVFIAGRGLRRRGHRGRLGPPPRCSRGRRSPPDGAPAPAPASSPVPAGAPPSASVSSALRDRRILPDGSMFTTLTRIWSPSFTSLRTSCTRWCRHLGDVQQAVRARDDLDERAEVHHAHDLAQVGLVELRGRGQLLDDGDGLAGGCLVGRGDRHAPVVLHVDLAAGALHDRADHLAARPDDVADLVHRDLDRDDARRERADVGARLRERLGHLVQDVEPARGGPAPAPRP